MICDLTEATSAAQLLGESDSIQRVRDIIQMVGPTNANILILGESGVGKELVARAIHHHSPRRRNPFVAVNCAAFAPNLIESELFGHEKGAFTGAIKTKPGYFERAQGGTLFLDEIGELPVQFQAKLLRVIQERLVERIGATAPLPLDVRLVTATHRNLEKGITQGWFRRDLYYRINVISIEISPLRKRRSDIPGLVRHFLCKHTPGHIERPLVVSADCIRALQRYPFPGNVRELENIVQRAVVLSGARQILLDHLPAVVRKGANASTGAEPCGVNRAALIRALQNARVYTKGRGKILWHRQLRCIRMETVLAFLMDRGREWFSRGSFARYLEAGSVDHRCKYKTAGVYLNILRKNRICVHNGQKANRSAYRLDDRFIQSRSEPLRRADLSAPGIGDNGLPGDERP